MNKLLFAIALMATSTPTHARVWFPWTPFPGQAIGLDDCGKGFFLGFSRTCWRRIY